MNELITLFLNNLLPVLLVAGAGYLLSKFTNLNPSSLSKVTFYIFSPCLIFTLLTQNKLSDGDILRVASFAIATTFLIGLLTWIAGKILKLDRRMLASILLATMFMNSGNYGLSVVLFAFGDTALSYASLYFVVIAILAYTLGVIIASMGTASLSQAFLNLFKIPMLYAVILALIYNRTAWSVPVPLDRAINILADASIPTMIVLLGLQLKSVDWSKRKKPLLLASSMRLLVSPLLAIGLVPAFGFSGLARQAIVIESAMPTAVLTSLLATEYNTEPSFVTSVIFITTIISPITLTPLLAFLGA